MTTEDLAAAIERLELGNRVIELHASLRSFPRLDGGPDALVRSFLDAGCTVLVPTMATELFALTPPAGDRPARNGIDYDAEDRRSRASARVAPAIYDARCTEVDSGLGAVAAHVAARPDRLRCRYPVGSFSAIGPRASELIGAEVTEDVFGPLRALTTLDGTALLVGVSLIRLTLLHLAEVEAGRRPFIRWALDANAAPLRVRCGECSMGFDNLAAILEPVERRTSVGASLWRALPAVEVVRRASAAIGSDPAITHCPNPRCLECADAVAGGPIE